MKIHFFHKKDKIFVRIFFVEHGIIFSYKRISYGNLKTLFFLKFYKLFFKNLIKDIDV